MHTYLFSISIFLEYFFAGERKEEDLLLPFIRNAPNVISKL